MWETLTAEQTEKFWENTATDKNGCFLWRGSVTARGFGKYFIGTKRVWADTVAWEIVKHEALPEGIKLMHTCGVANCVNPDHLVPEGEFKAMEPIAIKLGAEEQKPVRTGKLAVQAPTNVAKMVAQANTSSDLLARFEALTEKYADLRVEHAILQSKYERLLAQTKGEDHIAKLLYPSAANTE
jgi:hypothetical protein